MDLERWRKFEILIFHGDEDAFSWVNKLENYFRIKNVTEEEKIQAVMVSLDGRVPSWFL